MKQFCGNCGAENQGTPFCQSCGQKLDSAPQAIEPALTSSTRPEVSAASGAVAAASTAEPAVPEPTSVIGSPLYIAALICCVLGIAVSYIGSFVIPMMSYDDFSFWYPVLRWAPIPFRAIAALLVTIAGFTSVIPSRRASAGILGIAALLMVAMVQLVEFYSVLVYLLVLTLAHVLLFLAWAVGRPLRILGYVALPIGIIMKVVVVLVFFRLYDVLPSNVASMAELLAEVMIVVGTVLVALAFDRLSRKSSSVGEAYSATGAAAGGAPYRPAGNPYQAAGPVASTNGFAIAALVLGIVGGGVVGIVFGHVALSQIQRTGQAGKGMAVAGLVLSYFWLVVIAIIYIFMFSQFGRLL